MAATLSASAAGLKIFEQARTLKGWNKTASGINSPWPLEISKSTMERFHKGQQIKHEKFIAICEAVGVKWQEIIDRDEGTAQKETIGSNLSNDRSASTELDIFSQAIFDWFGALGFGAALGFLCLLLKHLLTCMAISRNLLTFCVTNWA